MPGTKRVVVASLIGLSLTACSTVQTPSKSDPWEGFNRTVFTFNEKVDSAVIRPVAKGYVNVVPQPIRTSVSSFFSNIGDVTVAANKFAQGDIAAGSETVMRVVINTIFGVGGLFDVATQAKLPKYHADFGLTLGHYGVPSGPYLVLPILGPSSVRDASGFAVDRFIDPSSYISPSWVSYVLYGVRAISIRASLLGATDLLSSAALDKYSFVRNAYLQRRQSFLMENSATMTLPSYGDPDAADGKTKTP